ncbi:MAG: hypothetical protein AAGA58_05435 [Verrucomicrobiota bacterium]
MPQKVITGIRSSQKGPNYKAVHESMQRSAGQAPSRYRTVESVKFEQEIERQTHTHSVKVRSHKSRNSEEKFKVTVRGIFYVIATIALIVFVKVMLERAGPGGFLEDPSRGPKVVN